MTETEKVSVITDGKAIGTLAFYDKRRTAFEYSQEWLETGYSISPFSLPLKPGLFIADRDPFDGVFGVFDDSLPDGWGRLVTDRFLTSRHIRPDSVSVLQRLCMLSDDSEGMLEYRPQLFMSGDRDDTSDLESFFRISRSILSDKNVAGKDLDSIFRNGGSSGGARPKLNIILDDEIWIVKFPTSFEGHDAGKKEYEVNRKAEASGIDIPEIRLLPSSSCDGFFASKRFDRKDGRHIHMISLSGLLESSHRFPALDYSHLMKAVQILTGSDVELWKAFRLAVFNVAIGNMDDHGKNFAFLFSEEDMAWHLSPAYDLTRSTTYFGEHSTTVMGKGKNITEDDLIDLASSFKLSRKEAERVIREIYDIVG